MHAINSVLTTTPRRISSTIAHSHHQISTMRSWSPTVTWNAEVEEYLASVLGRDRLEAISAATVAPPLTTCLRVNTLRTTPQQVVEGLQAELSPDDRQMLEASGHQPYIHPTIPCAVMVPGSGPHHGIDYDVCGGLEVIVGRTAGESMLRGSNCYAPGVLACTADIKAGDLVAVSIGIELPGTTNFGVTRNSVLPKNIPLDDPRFPNRHKMFIGTGRAAVPRTKMNASSSGLVLSMVDRVFRTIALGGVLKGQVMLQNLPSLTAAHVLNPLPNSRVLDMCASPGGKTTAMAQIMQNKGEIVALDRTHSKASAVTSLAEQLGITCIKAYKQDATKALLNPSNPRKTFDPTGCPSTSAHGRARLARIAAAKARRGVVEEERKAELTDGFEAESFDYILLDGPCSALGLRPRLILPQTLEELKGTVRYQRAFIDQAVRLLKPGGFMVYSTCTINPMENEGNVRYMLDKYPFMRLVDGGVKLGGPGLVGEGLLGSADEAEMVQRFDPSGPLDTIGFFIAKFEKIAPLNC